MKAVIGAIAVITLAAASASAQYVRPTPTFPATNFQSTHTAVSVTSYTQCSLTVAWEMVDVTFYNVDGDTFCYVRTDGSTVSIVDVGIPIEPGDCKGVTLTVWPPSGIFYLQMAAGFAAQDIRAHVRRKRNP